MVTPIDPQTIRADAMKFLSNPTPEAFGALAQMAGIAGKELPQEMAKINEVLDAMPDELANVLLINYFNDLYV